MWTRSRFLNEYVPGLFALAVDSYITSRAESMWEDMCTIKTSAKKKEEDSIRSGLGLPVRKGEGASITYDTQIEGGKQTWVHNVWALAVRLTEEAIEDNLYDLRGGGNADELSSMFRDLGEAMNENIESQMARFLVYGTSTTYHATRESKALFATDHPRLDSSTYSNKLTASDLTYSSFWAAVVAAENQFNHRQYKIKKKIKNLWYPPQLEKQAREILQSPDRPDTANRAINAYAKSGRNMGMKSWPHLTDTDAWYLQLDGRGIIFFWRRKTRFGREQDFQTGDWMCKADQRWSAEIADERDWFGNVPA